MKRLPLLISFALFSALPAAAATLDLPVWHPTSGVPELPAYRGDRLSLRLTPAAARLARARAIGGATRALGVSAIDQALASIGASIRPEFRGETPPPPGSSAPDFTSFYLVDLPPGAELSSALDRFASLSEVEGASAIGVASVTAIPNDSLWADSWHLDQPSRLDVHAPEAWDVTQGDTSIVLAIIDTGVIPYHPDLGGVTPGSSGQIWTHAAEATGIAGVDDDGNGYVDDVHGWDFVALPIGGEYAAGEDWRDEDNDPNDFVGHGTTVAGIAGALSNNGIGITGTAWKTRIMPLRVGWATLLNPTGVVDMSYIAQAVRYATLNGARVINISLSTTVLAELDLAVSAALAAGVDVVVAAGNNGSTHGISDFPALIDVTATDRNDIIPPWANVGAYVDFAAPGAAIPATNLRRIGPDSLGMRQPGYIADANGTSFAAPIASGAVALLQAARIQSGRAPLDPEMAKLVLMSGCDDLSAANPGAPSIYYGAGRLNIIRALEHQDFIHLANLPGSAPGSPVEFTRSNGQKAIAAIGVPSGTGISLSKLVFFDSETLIPFKEISLNGVVTGELAAADLGRGRGLGFFAVCSNRFIAGIGGGGRELPGWPVFLPLGIRSATAPVLGDLDGDGELDVVTVLTDYYGFEAVWAWDVTGHLRRNFPVSLGQATGFPPALADLDGAPGLEIVVQDADQYTHALRHDGSSMPGWPVSTLGVAGASPVVTRRDGQPLVVVTHRRNWYAIRSDGSMALQRDLTSDLVAQDPVLVDLDHDGTDDVLIAANSALHAWYLGSSPTPSASWPLASSPENFTASPLVGHLLPAEGPEILQPTQNHPVTLNLDGTRVRGLPAHTPVVHTSLLAPVHGTRARLVTSYASARLISYELDDGSWDGDLAPWPTARGNFARTGCRFGAPPMTTADDVPPTPITDLRAEIISSTMVRLMWHAPLDPAGGKTVAYDLRSKPSPISPGDFDQLPRLNISATARAAGEPETLEVVAVDGRNYYFRMLAVDGSGNRSELSNQVAVGSPSSTPDPVTGVEVVGASTSEIRLQWMATGEDGWVGRPARYEIAASPLAMTTVEFERTPFKYTREATVNAGAVESTILSSLPPDTHYWIAIRAVDAEGRRSTLSDVAEATTAPIGAHVEDRLAPTAVTDLQGGAVTFTSGRLTWTAPADDAPLGRVVRYELRYASVPLTLGTFQNGVQVPTPAWPKASGEAETLTVTVPVSESRFYSLRSFDAAGHGSALSNTLQIVAPRAAPNRVTDLRVVAASESLVTLQWSASGAAGTVGRAAAYEIYASGSLLSQGTLGEALFRVTVPAVVAAGDLERRDVSGLPRWMHLWIGIRARNAFDVWSPLSNLVEVQTVNGFVGGGFALELASNPARAPVRFRFSLGSESSGNLALHDVTGRRVRELPLGSEASGFVAWNADDSNGRRLPAGLYFAVLSTPSRRTVTRVVLLP